jgi:O-antigen ligase
MLILGSYQIIFINTSRTGYIAYVILMSLLILQKYSFKKAMIGIMFFSGSIMLAYTLSPVMKVKTDIMIQDIKLLRHNQANTSLGYRLQFHQYAQALFKEHPIIGIGTGGFPYRYSKDLPFPSWGPKLNEPHGQYWLTLAEQGLIGIVLLIFFLITLFITAFQLEEKKIILLGLLVSFCILSFSDTIFCYSPIGYLLTLFTALCFGELVAKCHLRSDNGTGQR